MRGFCGEYIVGRSAARVDAAVLRRMRDTMVHRGPDNCGLWCSQDRCVGLAGPLVNVRVQEYLSRAARGEDLFWAGATVFG